MKNGENTISSQSASDDDYSNITIFGVKIMRCIILNDYIIRDVFIARVYRFLSNPFLSAARSLRLYSESSQITAFFLYRKRDNILYDIPYSDSAHVAMTLQSNNMLYNGYVYIRIAPQTLHSRMQVIPIHNNITLQ